MIRRLLTAGSALSLVLWAAVMILWWRSCRTADRVCLTLPYGSTPAAQPYSWSLTTCPHRLLVCGFFAVNDPRDPPSLLAFGFARPEPSLQWEPAFCQRFGFWALGFGWAHVGGTWVLSAPLWLVGLLALIVPGFHASHVRRKRRRARLGLCRRCGYDLRASKDRCPECGTPISAEAGQKT